MALKPIFESIDKCRICSSLKIQEILDLGDQPAANSLYPPGGKEPPYIPLRMVFCECCNTVQIAESVDPHYLFSKYVWVTGTSKTAVDYSHLFAEEALKRCEVKHPFVLEIASNDGTFLKRFLEKGCRVLGVDPAENLAKDASNSGIHTCAKFFNKKLSTKLLLEHGFADILIARNVIPHVKEIHSVIEGISSMLDLNGTGIIEFHESRMVSEELQYDSIYHEHLFFFSLHTIGYLLRLYGLKIYDLIRSPISGGAWVIYFSKGQKDKSLSLIKAEREEQKSGVNTIKNWLLFSKKASSHRNSLQEIICSSKKKILAYGASARSSTLLNYCGLNHNHISAVIDKNPLKHGMLTPGSKIPIVSYDIGLVKGKGLEKILLLAWNFQEEVVEELRNSGYKGQFIIPLPGEPRIQ